MIEDDLFGIESEKKIKKSGVREVFTPHKPTNNVQLFFGRKDEVKQLIGYLNTPGQHALIFGDRGVGKSSIANVTTELLLRQIMGHKIVRKRCDSTDTFVSVVGKILKHINIDIYQDSVSSETNKGLSKIVTANKSKASQHKGYSKKADSPSWVAEKVKDIQAIYVIDEVDSISNNEDKRKIAELVKQLSDQASSLKILLVGISETASELVAGHPSVNRCLKEVRIKNMDDHEIREIITGGSERLELPFEKNVIRNIISLSSGYPHFAHLLALKAAEQAIINEKDKVSKKDLDDAIGDAVNDAEGTLRAKYNKAARSAQSKEYKKILLATSLCEENEIKAKEIRDKYGDVFDEEINQGKLNNYFQRLVANDDSAILKRIAKGVYKFNDPRMPSYIRIAQSYISN